MSQYRQFVLGEVLDKIKGGGGIVDVLGSIQTELANAGEVDLSLDVVDIAGQVIKFIDKLEARRNE